MHSVLYLRVGSQDGGSGCVFESKQQSKMLYKGVQEGLEDQMHGQTEAGGPLSGRDGVMTADA